MKKTCAAIIIAALFLYAMPALAGNCGCSKCASSCGRPEATDMFQSAGGAIAGFHPKPCLLQPMKAMEPVGAEKTMWFQKIADSINRQRPCAPQGLPPRKREINGGYEAFFNWQVVLGGILVALSATVYYIHYLLFRDVRHIFLYLIGDIGFLFIEVLIVTLILHKLLTAREKRSMMKKLNMVIGAFFSEVGTELMRKLCAFDASAQVMGRHMMVTKDWTKKQFIKMSRAAMEHQCSVDCKKADIPALKEFLMAKRGFLLTLLENPNLLEHETFTNLLWAVFHLTEELANRNTFVSLPQADYDHLAGDIRRAEGLLIREWLAYMEHLKSDYPYLFSLAVRMNPFDPDASAVVS